MRHCRTRIGVCLLFWSSISSVAFCGEETIGEVQRRAAKTLLISTDSGVEAFAAAHGTTISGVAEFREIMKGDPVTITWSEEHNGFKIAEAIAIMPEQLTDANLLLGIGEFKQLFEYGNEMPLPSIIDVRPMTQFQAGHVPGAISIPLDQIDKQTLFEIKNDHLLFYSNGKRCSLAQRAVRKALSFGLTGVQSLRGGCPAWVESGGYLTVEPALLARQIEAGDVNYVIVDIRATSPEQSTLPGAVSVPYEKFLLQRKELLGDPWMYRFLVLGDDDQDERVIKAAEKVIAWRSTDSERTKMPVFVLAGGMKQWIRDGHDVVDMERASTELVFRENVAQGQIGVSDFRQLWMAHGRAMTTLLDVRSARIKSETWVLHVPLEDLADRIAELKKDHEIIIFCDEGNRAVIAHHVLASLGFRARFLPTGLHAIE